ncbi:deoxyribose-phosphate aldolase [candidate division KSB1 bacterium]|nr:deoxyribose-phosphate aldolase [candidate division KSB1 bacterium]
MEIIVEHVYKEILNQLSRQNNSQHTVSQEKEALTRAQLAKYIDHTLLRPDATEAEILQLCREAQEYGFATVCVNPIWVKLCSDQLAGSGVQVCSVIGFPLGASTTCLKVEEAKRAVSDGALEIDMVINVGKLLGKDFSFVYNDIRRVVETSEPALVKVILETCLLNDEQKVAACAIVKKAGAHFVKTSTGFNRAGATVADVTLMRQVVGQEMGVKAAGGIRNYDTAVAMIRAGADRLGTSSSVEIVKAR